MRLARTLARYGEYHRDRRNVATHVLGIPMIVLAVEILLSRPALAVGALEPTPAWLASAAAAVFYLRLDIRLGLVMAAFLAFLVAVGGMLASAGTAIWLGTGIGLFVVGWVFQLVGHGFEGRKPAFLDDLKSLLIGPLFVVAEMLFVFGLFGELRRAVKRAATERQVDLRDRAPDRLPR